MKVIEGTLTKRELESLYDSVYIERGLVKKEKHSFAAILASEKEYISLKQEKGFAIGDSLYQAETILSFKARRLYSDEKFIKQAVKEPIGFCN